MAQVELLDLTSMSDRYNCKYFIEDHTRDGETLAWALRAPFQKLYSLGHERERLDYIRKRFADNNRVQVFHQTHPASFFEMVKLIPDELASVIWLHKRSQWGQALKDIAILRPAKKDPILLDLTDRISTVLDQTLVNRYYGATHRPRLLKSDFGRCLVLLPKDMNERITIVTRLPMKRRRIGHLLPPEGDMRERSGITISRRPPKERRRIGHLLQYDYGVDGVHPANPSGAGGAGLSG